MTRDTTRLKKGKGLNRIGSWLVTWMVLVVFSLDFFNWGQIPRLYMGLPGWLWWEVGVVLLTTISFGLLSRFAWGDE